MNRRYARASRLSKYASSCAVTTGSRQNASVEPSGSAGRREVSRGRRAARGSRTCAAPGPARSSRAGSGRSPARTGRSGGRAPRRSMRECARAAADPVVRLQHEHTQACASQVARRDQAVVAGADHDRVGLPLRHVREVASVGRRGVHMAFGPTSMRRTGTLVSAPPARRPAAKPSPVTIEPSIDGMLMKSPASATRSSGSISRSSSAISLCVPGSPSSAAGCQRRDLGANSTIVRDPRDHAVEARGASR